MIKRAAVVAIAGAIASPAIAQNEATPPPTVEVIGIGTVKSPPDIARLSFDIRGEGTTADKATQALVDRQKDVVDALTGLLGGVRVEVVPHQVQEPWRLHGGDVDASGERPPVEAVADYLGVCGPGPEDSDRTVGRPPK